ncbi:hypothetical protein FHS10_005279 [Mucilaginibacter dorajii]|nr:hypothetical protein [Mucilaginibacter dorajii]
MNYSYFRLKYCISGDNFVKKAYWFLSENLTTLKGNNP